MDDIVITYAGSNGNGPDYFALTPCFQARRGDELLLKTWTQLTKEATYRLEHELQQRGVTDTEDQIGQALLRYGAERTAQTVREAVASGLEPTNETAVWQISSDNTAPMLKLLTTKACEYQVHEGRDYFCTTPSPGDNTARYAIGNRRAAPTSLPLCNGCALPSTEYLCSSMSHPEITGVNTMNGIMGRRPVGAICNADMPEIGDISGCHAGGHECWNLTVQVADAVDAPQSAPSDLPDALDTLGGFWRLAFGKDHQLIAIHRLSSTATLLVGCSTRAEFESRVSALHDVLDKLKIDDALLPDDAAGDIVNGSMNQLETCIKDKLPQQQHQACIKAIRVLRQVRKARVALQHTGGDNDLSTALLNLGINDAPPNWSGAWDRIRATVADALNGIRRELGIWIDSQQA